MISRFLPISAVLCLAVYLTGCTPHAVREAQAVVAEADSLWRGGQMYGIDDGDSATLAEAYETLKEHTAASSQFSDVFPFVHRTFVLRTYAHACYHYGRLLRKKDNPVEAMQAFISATHSRTRDYHILGRVYSNMGSICHLAGEYDLSYDMFEKSAEMFLCDKDTLSYYFSLNDMAFELAVQSKKEEALALLDSITRNINDKGILAKTWETKAKLYLMSSQNDSAIYYANHLRCFERQTYPTLILAQAYDNLKLRDSALVYANKILFSPNAQYQERFDAIYIVINNDSTLNSNEINSLASQREDIRYYEYEPKKEKLSQAVQLLEQDLNRRPDLRWLYFIIITLGVVGIGIGIYVHYQRCKHRLLSQQVEDLSVRNNDIQQKYDYVVHEHEEHKRIIMDDIEKNCALIAHDDSFPQNICWSNFKAMCSIMDRQFYMLASKLRQKQALSEKEIRLCVLVLFQKSRSEIADTLPYSLSGIGKLKDHTAKKLGTTGKNLRYFLLHMLIEG